MTTTHGTPEPVNDDGDDAARINGPQMQQLLRSGRARPLLEDHFPVPVELDGHWWHLPDSDPSGFVRAPAALAVQFARLAVRRHAADTAVARGAGR